MSDWGAGSQPAARARAWRWRALIAFLVVLGVLIGGYLTRRGTGELAFIASGLQETLAPVQERVSGLLRTLSQRLTLLTHYWQVDSENQRLRQEIVQLQLELASLKEARRENELLRQLLNMNAPPEYKVVSATIIGRSPRQWSLQVTIDRGRDQAVDVGAVVLSTGGVIGRVVAATPSSARVLLLTDPSSAVGGLVERTGDLVLVEGAPGSPTGLKARTLSPHAELATGDVILTSGLGGVFPKGLQLGTVLDVKADPYGLATVATVQPAADFGRMEYLLVLTANPKSPVAAAPPKQSPARQETPVAASQAGPGDAARPSGQVGASPQVQTGDGIGQTRGGHDSTGPASMRAAATSGATAAADTAVPVSEAATATSTSPAGNNQEPSVSEAQAGVRNQAWGDGDGATPAGSNASTNP